MSSAGNRQILIAGAGLGGLAAAVALLQRGFQVAIFEKASELREIGAGLSVWPNATSVLRELGLLDAAVGQSERIERLRLMTWRGKLLSEISAVARCETPTICIHRADLMTILKNHVPRECIYLSEKLVGFDENDGAVAARLASGRRFTGDALIGADGIQSTVRSGLLGESKPTYRGYQAWRGVARSGSGARPSGTAFEFWGHGKRVGVEPLSGGRTFWYATVNAPQGTLGDPASWKDEALQLFRDWVSPVPEVIEATDPGAILKHEMEDRLPVRKWGRGRVTLLGDAAHLTTPNLGQGACMALEDALVLARSLAENVMDISAGLRRYESLRYARTAFLTREARRVGWVGQLNNRFAVGLRTGALRLIPTFLSEMRHREYFSFEN
jgi:2-polyprenyl-6-methoxyphenol hydroxylase-like FAD-dependent oxidoreductase